MRYGSLFSGIGGFDLGLDRAGMQCVWQVEVDPFCLGVLRKHWPDVPKYKDVRNVGRHNLSTVDLICGGFPCQPHSVAGKRRGAADDRNLWPEFLRVVEELRPTWVLAENVPGIVSLYLDTVLADLEGEGYTCWTFNIPACAFDAPHRRERIFVVAHADGGGQQGQNLPVRPGRQDETSLVAARDRKAMAYANCERLPEQRTIGGQAQYTSIEPSSDGRSWWAIEPAVGRVALGIPNRVDRLRALGNAVVPQIAEWIGQSVMETERK